MYLVKELILVGVDVNLGNGSKILLIVICEKGFVDIMKELILVCVDVNFKNGYLMLLIIVCENGYVYVV